MVVVVVVVVVVAAAAAAAAVVLNLYYYTHNVSRNPVTSRHYFGTADGRETDMIADLSRGGISLMPSHVDVCSLK